MSMFDKEKPCQSVKIWSRQQMDSGMMQFGWSAYHEFNRDLQTGSVSSSVCVYSNKFYSAWIKKTKGGCGSVIVSRAVFQCGD